MLVGPHAAGAGVRVEPLPPTDRARAAVLGPEMRGGERGDDGVAVSVFPHAYQRFAARAEFEPPELVALFHPGLDIHYFAWYALLREWALAGVPVLVTAYAVPGGAGESPAVVRTLLEALVGGGGGAGMWVYELDNAERAADAGSFNAGYFVVKGSQGALPARAEEMYFPVFEALRRARPGIRSRRAWAISTSPTTARATVDGAAGFMRAAAADARAGGGARGAAAPPRLLAAIAEGAYRAATVGADGCGRRDRDDVRDAAARHGGRRGRGRRARARARARGWCASAARAAATASTAPRGTRRRARPRGASSARSATARPCGSRGCARPS